MSGIPKNSSKKNLKNEPTWAKIQRRRNEKAIEALEKLCEIEQLRSRYFAAKEDLQQIYDACLGEERKAVDKMIEAIKLPNPSPEKETRLEGKRARSVELFDEYESPGPSSKKQKTEAQIARIQRKRIKDREKKKLNQSTKPEKEEQGKEK